MSIANDNLAQRFSSYTKRKKCEEQDMIVQYKITKKICDHQLLFYEFISNVWFSFAFTITWKN